MTGVFYDAVRTNDTAVLEVGDETLKTIARKLVATVRDNASLDWKDKETVRAKLRASVRRLLIVHRCTRQLSARRPSRTRPSRPRSGGRW